LVVTFKSSENVYLKRNIEQIKDLHVCSYVVFPSRTLCSPKYLRKYIFCVFLILAVKRTDFLLRFFNGGEYEYFCLLSLRCDAV
jgi:hypothetical protein